MLRNRGKIGLVLFLLGIGLDVGKIYEYLVDFSLISKERSIIAFFLRIIGIVLLLTATNRSNS